MQAVNRLPIPVRSPRDIQVFNDPVLIAAHCERERQRLLLSVDSAIDAIDSLKQEKNLRALLLAKGLPVPDNASLGLFLLRIYDEARAPIYGSSPHDDNFLGLGREVSNLLKTAYEDSHRAWSTR